MQDDNRRVVGYMYIHGGIVVKVLNDSSWTVETSNYDVIASNYVSFWRRPDGVWESVMGDGGTAGAERSKIFDNAYGEYLSKILEKQ